MCMSKHLILICKKSGNIVSTFLLMVLPFLSFSQQTENGFIDHGVASPISNHRGTVATVDGNGRNTVLTWLFDHRGGYALLMVNAETGESEEFPVPFKLTGDAPYASLLSSKNKFYTLFNNYFVEFDPAKRVFTFHHATSGSAMSLTEDNKGKVWAVTYPNSVLVSFDPETLEFHDYGSVYQQNWKQYPRSIAVDDTGWVYFSIGFTASQIVAFDPRSQTVKPMLETQEREKGMAHIYAGKNGKVYGRALEDGDVWYEFYGGRKNQLDGPPISAPKKIIAGSQSLFYEKFPDGKRIKSMDFNEHLLLVEDPVSHKTKQVAFDYSSEGAIIMGVAVAPDGTISGGTTFPMRFFSYNPEDNTWVNRLAYDQFNTLASQGHHLFIGGYGKGFLLEWDPSKPWVDTEKESKESNPVFRFEATPTIYRPHRLLAHPDGKTIIMSGTPAYGHTGGGLLFWNRETEQPTLLDDKAVIPDQSTMGLVALPGHKILGGTTTAAGTGGEKKADEAELYVMDMASKRVVWNEPVIKGAQTYSDLCLAENRMVYGIADGKVFFVFDPDRKSIVYQKDVAAQYGPTTWSQCPRIFVRDPNGETYILFAKGIARIEKGSHEITWLADAPEPILAGGAFYKGRIYFSTGSHLYSYKLDQRTRHSSERE